MRYFPSRKEREQINMASQTLKKKKKKKKHDKFSSLKLHYTGIHKPDWVEEKKKKKKKKVLFTDGL